MTGILAAARQTRPHRRRARLSLDGAWDFRMEGHGGWRTASVPGPWQAMFADLRTASGVATYARTFTLPAAWQGREVALRFGAVSYLCEVMLNGHPLGAHEGGYLPFELVLPPARLLPENRLEVKVILPDGDEAAYPHFPFAEIPHGKQSWYGPLGGIWQSVALEARDARHVTRCRVAADLATGAVRVDVDLSADLDATLALTIVGPGEEPVAGAEIPVAGTTARLEAVVDPVLPWSPDRPDLYRATLDLVIDGLVVDTVVESFGFRHFETHNGHFFLNGQPFYLRGALDQDYYPDGICTPPSLTFLEDQLRKAKSLGLNCLRCHIKVPDPRYHEVADRLGMLVWAEIPNVETFTERSAGRLRETMAGILARDGNHPSIVVWTLINEDWGTRLAEDPGQRRWLAQSVDWLKAQDPTRLVVDNSPCSINFHVKTDIDDYHYYRGLPERRAEWDLITEEFAAGAGWSFTAHGEAVRTGLEPRVVSEFGAWGLPHPCHLRRPDGAEPWWFEGGQGWADGAVTPHGIESRFEAYRLDRVFGDLDRFIVAAQWHQFNNLKYQIETLRAREQVAGYVVTELTDVHWEANGLMDIERNPRVFHERFAEINADIVIVPVMHRWSFWSGEDLVPDLRLAAGGCRIPPGSSLTWRLDDGGESRRAAPAVAAHRVVPVAPIRVVLPEVDRARMVDLHFGLFGPDGTRLAVNRVSVAVHPGRDLASPRPAVAADDPAWRRRLAALGYRVVDAGAAEVVLTRRLDASGVEAIRQGARVLLLAEDGEGSLRADPPAREPPFASIVDATPGLPAMPYFRFPGVGFSRRDGTIWRGDWVGNFSWLRRHGPFASLPGGPLLDLTFDRVVPRAVITGMRPWEFDGRVHAGVVVGWIHKAAATVFEKAFGQGLLVATTFRLAEDPPTADPTATALLDALILLAHRSRDRTG